MSGLKIRFAVYFCILAALSFFAYKNFQAKYTASLSAVLQYLPNEKKIEALQKIKTESIRTEDIKTELLEKLMYREDYSFFYLMLCAVFVLILIYTEVIFKDDGSGIQKEALRSVFNRFYKTPDSKGFGLGLNIAKSIAEKNNGTLCAYNENGAVFKFTFYKS
ncbi:hypothetical protein E4O04_07545 [Treponema sp. OMZ 799]|uniref:ATP-binding protein n=1 Tax=Treponema sp. OMZ 799 TaxID=2563668 RepID=UPI0020A5547F|nr:ATP-binding protein [Treponema sp. OMZ 799]UTC77858.1 hypothetical protein E4O04_07545 [Treponema sp. OMZ 799]